MPRMVWLLLGLFILGFGWIYFRVNQDTTIGDNHSEPTVVVATQVPNELVQTMVVTIGDVVWVTRGNREAVLIQIISIAPFQFEIQTGGVSDFTIYSQQGKMCSEVTATKVHFYACTHPDGIQLQAENPIFAKK